MEVILGDSAGIRASYAQFSVVASDGSPPYIGLYRDDV